MYRFRRWIQNLKIISKDPFVILKVICCLLIFNDFLMSFWKIQKKFLGCNFFFFSLYPLGSGSIWTFLGSWDPDPHNNRCGSPTLAKRLFHKTQNLLNRYTVIKLQHLNNGRQGTEDMRRETWEVRHETWDRRETWTMRHWRDWVTRFSTLFYQKTTWAPNEQAKTVLWIYLRNFPKIGVSVSNLYTEMMSVMIVLA